MPTFGILERFQRTPWQLLGQFRRQLLCALALAPVFAAVHAAAYWLRFGTHFGVAELRTFATPIAFVVLAKVVVFGWFRVYQGWSRYVTFHDLVVLGRATTASSLLLLLGDYLLFPAAAVPRSIFLLDWGITLVVVGGLRSLFRLIEERQPAWWATARKTPVFIVGANDSGEALLRATRRNPALPYRVAGFVTDDRSALGSCIGGVPVLGMLDQTCELAEKYGVPEVLITAGELSGKEVRDLIEDGRQREVSVKVLPSYDQLLSGSVDLRPRTVSIEDLLRRDPVQLDLDGLHRWIDGQVLLVTGSAGSIGSEICRQALKFAPRRLVAVDRSENGQFFLERELRALSPGADIEVCIADITDRSRMDRVFREHTPGIVFHAAAYKHVPLMEAHPGEAVKNIALATRIVADLAEEHGADSFVMTSTDKAVNPTNVMGACKRVAELYVQALAAGSRCRFVTVRFGNVLDSAGSVVGIFREQIARGGPVTVTHPDMTRFFMTIPEASQLVLQAGAMGQGGEIFVLDMGEPVRIVDLAEDMIRLSGLQLGNDIEIEVIGTRPGEKLYEELVVEGERPRRTEHPKIMVMDSKTSELRTVRLAMQCLAMQAEGPRTAILDQLQQLVPQFRPAGEPQRIILRAAA